MKNGTLLPRVGQEPSLFIFQPRQVCQQIGLQWNDAQKLFADGYLSFSPDCITNMDMAQESELRFVGSLVVNGCEPRMLQTLLSTLPKPYNYEHSQIRYDWERRKWFAIPKPGERLNDLRQSIISDWLDDIRDRGDDGELSKLMQVVNDEANDNLRAELLSGLLTKLEEKGDVDALRDISDQTSESADELDEAYKEVVKSESEDNAEEEDKADESQHNNSGAIKLKPREKIWVPLEHGNLLCLLEPGQIPPKNLEHFLSLQVQLLKRLIAEADEAEIRLEEQHLQDNLPVDVWIMLPSNPLHHPNGPQLLLTNQVELGSAMDEWRIKVKKILPYHGPLETAEVAKEMLDDLNLGIFIERILY